MEKFIPVNEPYLNGNEAKYLKECIQTGWISSEGPFVSEFEEKMSKRIGRKFAIAVSSGTAALDVSVDALGIGKGDEVIVPTFTIISCLNQIIRSGAKPILIDSNPITWNMDTSQIEKKINKRTRAIVAVHIYGITVDIDPILDLAKKYNLFVIEDAAESIGQNYKDKPCGSFGDISTFSFYPNKHITTGEGGMIFTDDANVAEECKKLRNLYFNNKNRFVHDKLGWNFRMTNIQAAIGLAQLENLDEVLIKKRKVGNLYFKNLSKIDSLQMPPLSTNYCSNLFWVFGILIKDYMSFNSKLLREKLAQEGIGTRPFFYPMHLQPIFKKMGLFKNEKYPISEILYESGLYLPSSIGLGKKDIDEISNVLLNVIKQNIK